MRGRGRTAASSACCDTEAGLSALPRMQLLLRRSGPLELKDLPDVDG